ncbi:MAG: cytochrome C peroxidase [Hyphomicrobiaceae bacterium]|nr:cytochrome C peroxidase [Hyphomicrobiaceae bacterium]
MKIRISALAIAILWTATSFAEPREPAATASPERKATEFAVPLGLPPMPPRFATVQPAKVELGRKLFFDRRLSFNNTLSCAMCHLEEDAFASTQSKKSIGMEGRTLRRNAPSVLNVVYQRSLFHDGRENRIDLQVWMPLLAEDEMANPSMGYVLDRIGELDDYDAQFNRVYPAEGISVHSVGDAIAAYEATLLSANSRFDRWHFGGEKGLLTKAEVAGFQIFTGKGGCSTCHRIEQESALFTDHRFHNTGIGYRAAMGSGRIHVIPLAPGVTTSMSDSQIDAFGESPRNDVGRFEVTLKESDRWAYKTPSLRNVSRTKPYMHDGSIATLEDVVDFYSSGAAARHATDGILTRLDLSVDEKAELVAFLRTLDGEQRSRP